MTNEARAIRTPTSGVAAATARPAPVFTAFNELVFSWPDYLGLVNMSSTPYAPSSTRTFSSFKALLASPGNTNTQLVIRVNGVTVDTITMSAGDSLVDEAIDVTLEPDDVLTVGIQMIGEWAFGLSVVMS